MINDPKAKTALILSRHGEIDVEITRAIAREGCNLVLAFGQEDSHFIARRIEAEFGVQATSLAVDREAARWQADLHSVGSPDLVVNFIDRRADPFDKDRQADWSVATEELQWQLKTIGLLVEMMRAAGGVIVNYIAPVNPSSRDAADLAVLHSGMAAFVETISKQIASDRLFITNVVAERSGAAAARRAQIARLYKASPLAIGLAGVNEPSDNQRARDMVTFLASDQRGMFAGATLKVDPTPAIVEDW